ncbi:DNA helicase B-like [Watersipora subatra]|uniref:DNA helicase B-like n=1 Tax=Watersipora subatra TaxID=2589382 RepID=UPI00355C40B4
MGKKAKKDVLKTVRGYIIREDKPATRDDDFYSDDEDDNFDFAGNYVKKVPLTKTKVLMQTLSPDGQLLATSYIHGKFPYQGLWWHICVEVKVVHEALYSVGLPCYRLRTDLSCRKDVFNRLISTILSSDRVSSAALSTEVKVFQAYVNQLQDPDYTTMYSIEGLTQQIVLCSEQQPTQPQKSAILSLIAHLHNSSEMQEINLAVKYPFSMSTLPMLYPRTAHSILKCGITEAGFMAQVEHMIVNCPYELAFRSVIKKRTGRLFSEVSRLGLEKAGRWASIKQPYKDAVAIYGVLKEHCYGTGDTYMSVHRLNGQTPRYNGYILSAYRDAISYLKSNGSIVEEDSRVYLKCLYDSEKYISDTLSDMIASETPFTFPTDFSAEPLSVLAGDKHQLAAAKMISEKAVTVMSGRGGCGKTEVVARACQVALSYYYKLKLEEYDKSIKRLVDSHIERANKSQLESSISEDSKPQTESAACNTSEELQDDDSNSVISSSSRDWFEDSLPDMIDYTCLKEKLESDDEFLSGNESLSDSEEITPEEAVPSVPDVTKKSYILLTAPTGKAAKVLGRRTGFKGFTLHQVMFRYILWLQEPAPRSPFPFKDVAILVVDECSLVAVNNFSFLLHILKSHGQLQKIILLGDLLQLPSIEPGNFLTDVYSALSCKGCAITLQTNHRAEGRLIVENAIRISARCFPTFDQQRSFTSIPLADMEHLELARDDAVKQLISTEAFRSDRTSQFVAFRKMDCEVINNICSKAYAGEICIDSSTKRPTFKERFKICCSKNGTVNVVILHDPNNEAKDHLAPKASTMSEQGDMDLGTSSESISASEEELERKRMDMIKDRISMYIERAQVKSNFDVLSQREQEEIESHIKNDVSQLSQHEMDGEKRPLGKTCDMRLCNGELFWIKSIFMEEAIPPKKFSQERWILESEDGMIICALRSNLMRECRMKPSWCRTIHTFQGSEIKHLAYVVGAAGRQNWQHVYTAVTRGKSSVTIIGEEANLRKAINTCHLRRFCCLEEKLKEKFKVDVKKDDPNAASRVQQCVPGEAGSRECEVQYISDEEFDMLVDEQQIWGDTSATDHSIPTQHFNERKRKANSEESAKQQTENMFSQWEQFQHSFERKLSNMDAFDDDLQLSSDDEFFLDAKDSKQQQVHAAAIDNQLSNSVSSVLNNTIPYKVVQCQVTTGTEGEPVVVVPVITEPS